MGTYRHVVGWILLWTWVSLSLSACGGGSNRSSKDYYKNAVSNATVYVAPRPCSIQRVAVLPFKAPTELIGSSVSDIFTMELLRTERYTLVERSQISGVLGETELSLSGLSEEAAIAAGRMLGADGVILGTVDEYATAAVDGRAAPVVGASIRMIDCISGEVMWSVGHSSRSNDGLATLSGHARAVVLEMMVALVQNWELQPKAPQAKSHAAMAAPPPVQHLSPHPQVQQAPRKAEALQLPAQEQTAMQAPHDFSVSDMGLREVKLSWPKPAGELNYRIERADRAEGPFQEISTIPASQGSYDDRGTGKSPLVDGKTYYYRIFSMDQQGQMSQPSPVRESMIAPPPDPPRNLKIDIRDGKKVTVRWSPADAEGVVEYLVERRGPQNSSFVQIGKTDKLEFMEEGSASSPPENATQQHYRIRAVNRVGAIGEPSAAVQAVASGDLAAPPTATTATPSETPPAVADETLHVATPEKTKSMAEGTAVTPATGRGPEETNSKVEEIEQPDGTKVKKVVTTTITPQEGGGETTVVTTEKITTNKDGSSRKETQTYTTFKKAKAMMSRNRD